MKFELMQLYAMNKGRSWQAQTRYEIKLLPGIKTMDFVFSWGAFIPVYNRYTSLFLCFACSHASKNVIVFSSFQYNLCIK